MKNLSFLLIFLSSLLIMACTGEQGPEGTEGPAGPEGLVITTVVATPSDIAPAQTSQLIARVTNNTNIAVGYIWEVLSGSGEVIAIDTTNTFGTAIYASGSETDALITVTVFSIAEPTVASVGDVSVLVSNEDLVITTVVANPPVITPTQTSQLIARVANNTNLAVGYTWEISSGSGEVTATDTTNTFGTAIYTPGSETNALITVTVFSIAEPTVASVGDVSVLVSNSGIEPTFSLELLVYEASTETILQNNGQTNSLSLDVVALSNVPESISVGAFSLTLNGEPPRDPMDKHSSNGYWLGRTTNVQLVPNSINTLEVALSEVDGETINSSLFSITQGNPKLVETSELDNNAIYK